MGENLNVRNVILCYGDSNTYGYAPMLAGSFRYPEEDIWPAILERETGIRTRNLGLCGREIPVWPRQTEAIRQMLVKETLEEGPVLSDETTRKVDALSSWEGRRDFAGGIYGESCVPQIRLLIMLGTNDLLKHRNFLAEDVTARMEQFLLTLLQETTLQQKGSICIVPPPSMQQGEWVDEVRLLRESRRLHETYALLAKKLGIVCIQTGNWSIPLSFDGVHFTQEGHRIFAWEMAKRIRGGL